MAKRGVFGALGMIVLTDSDKHFADHDIEDVAAEWAAGNTAVTKSTDSVVS